MRLPSQRVLVRGGAALVVLALALGGGWFWYAAAQREARAAYAAAIAAAQPALAQQATPETRAAASGALEAVLANHPSAPDTALAALTLGQLRWAEGDWERARAAWQIAAAKADSSRTTLTVARASIAAAWEAAGNLENAAQAYRQALGGVGRQDFLYEQLLLDLARVEESLGRKAEAVATYRRILEEVPQTRRAEEIRARLLTLGAS